MLVCLLQFVSTYRRNAVLEIEHVRHALFVCLQDTGYALEAIRERVGLFRLPSDMGHRQTCRPLVQDQFPRIDHFGQLLQ